MLRSRALYLLIILVFLFPPLASPLSGSRGNVRAYYSPSFAMPLPTPAPAPALQPVAVSGVLRVLVIGAYFSDVNYTVSISQLKQSFFTGLQNYYGEISYGKISIQGDAYGWYKLPYPQSHYGKDCLNIDDADCTGQDGSWQIAQDVVSQAEKDVNFANYNYFVFIHSGDGQESSGIKDQVWSVTYMGGVSVETNAKTLFEFSIVPELEAGGAVSLGVWCHEFGHLLNLPDLFDTNTGKSILGPWSTMDEGTWNGNPAGSSPAHLISWGKIGLGFISGPMLATANPGVTSTFTIDPTEVVSNNIHAVEIPLGTSLNPSQYYLIEVRAAIGFDSALPAFGVLISVVNNNAVVGPVHIVDGHPNVANLEDAVWNVGQTFTDTQDGFSVTVTGKTGNSYQVTVNRGSAQPPPQPQNATYIDLAITSITAQPQVLTLANTTVTIAVQVTNSGTEAANNVPIEVDLDGQQYTNLQLSVDSGSTTSSTFTWRSALGSHTFKITIDPDNTLNNTNRANNVASFTLTVGPTLTINVPLNITGPANLWVMINGEKYNITTNQFQTSVPNGTITVEIQPGVNVSQGVRQGFAGWSDGNMSNPRQITVTSNTVLQALYTTQYLLTVNSNGGTTAQSGWYQPNKTVTVTAANPSNVTANSSRYIFTSWSGDFSSNSTTMTVTMNKPVTVNANWSKQYYLTIISPTGSPSGAGWYDAGAVVTVGVQSTVQYPNGTRLLFTGWNSTVAGNSPTTQITVNSPVRLVANWQTQYLITVNSEYGTAAGQGWYDAGSPAQASVPSEIDYTNGTRRIFAGWTGDYSGTSNNVALRVDAPKTLDAEWNTQYRVTFTISGVPNSTLLSLNLNNVTYELPAGSSYNTWVQDGTAINPTLNETITNGLMSYKFTGWRNSTGAIVQNPLAVKAPATFTASYTTQLSLPAIPGFPIEAIIVGLFLGLIAAVMKRNRKKEQIDSPKRGQSKIPLRHH
jgi:M6 family metalloprotease-like protein